MYFFWEKSKKTLFIFCFLIKKKVFSLKKERDIDFYDSEIICYIGKKGKGK